MLKASNNYSCLLTILLIFTEIALLVCLLTSFPVFRMSAKTLTITGFVLTACWGGGLWLVTLRAKMQDVTHLAVDFTNEPGLFTSIVSCLVFLISWLLFLIMALTAAPKWTNTSQKVDRYFEQIRRDQPLLTAFISSMPKGGDLHHHYSESIYAETYWQIISDSNGWMNMSNFEIDTPNAVHTAPWKRFTELSSEKCLDSLKRAFIQKAPMEHYDFPTWCPNQHSSAKFDKVASITMFGMQQGLQELKRRAISENVQYIETMLSLENTAIAPSDFFYWEKLLTNVSIKDSLKVFSTLSNLHAKLISDGIVSATKKMCQRLDEMHHKTHIDDSSFMVRYQFYARRSPSALITYKRLLTAFEAASLDTLVVGVNFGTQEEGELTQREHNLYMLMFAHFRRLYPSVMYSLHVGESPFGMVQQELLRNRIAQAVMIAHPKRIGNGVTIAYEANWKNVLDSMAKHRIPIEINLSSNEFFLRIKNEQHPILLYHSHKVPIIIGTDKAGVLRTNLTQQYILLTSRYPMLRYRDIKQIVKNSILYSFIKSATSKEQKLRDLDTAFLRFEKQVLNYERDKSNRR